MRYRLHSVVLAIDANGTLQHLPAGSILQIIDQGETGLITVRCEGKTFRSFLTDLKERGELEAPIHSGPARRDSPRPTALYSSSTGE